SEELLPKRLTSINPETGEPFFNAITALSFMAFVLLCFPCIATLAAIKSETGSWRWVVASVIYNTSLAWGVAWLIKVIGSHFLM
ncbi:MAG: nucleoside recognition domain-containing protein, partial [Bacteroidales bacterium]